MTTQQRRDRDRPAFDALRKGTTEALMSALAAGADANAWEPGEGTLLQIAIENDRPDLAAVLLEAGAHVEGVYVRGLRPLHFAVRKDTSELTRLLLGRGAQVGATADTGATPLHSAAEWGNPENVQLLLDAGAGPNIRTRRGMAPLHYAARKGHSVVCGQLIDAGADVNAVSKGLWGMAPLHVVQGSDSARKLLQAGADPCLALNRWLQGWVSVSPLALAAEREDWALCEELLGSGADPNARKTGGTTLLHWAVHTRNLKLCKALVRAGADPALKGPWGSAWDEADPEYRRVLRQES